MSASKTNTSKILFCLTGSIACFKACALISKLVQKGFEVQCVATSAALQFVGEATLEGLTGKPVFKDVYQAGRMMDHIHLNKWADLTLVCPATANSINKMAAGMGDDPVSTLILAHDFKKPLWIVPAMNQNMYAHPATKNSLLSLSRWGAQVLETESGHQACGDVGPGRMKEAEEIYKLVLNWQSKSDRRDVGADV
jgi:phosphopantothenoylcysteine decarboxylase / phosphopantothenate---cysteine ligase